MNNYSDIIVSTTSGLEGIRITDYVDLVSARIVTGTDWFSDLFAGFSDIFGGRSKTYQNQLKDIYQEVIRQLKAEAVDLGANAIVGLKIDHDEISGKGKQMFMVTATGTAVKIENNGPARNKFERLPLDKFNKEMQIYDKISRIKTKEWPVNEEWTFLIENKVSVVIEEVVEYIRKCADIGYIPQESEGLLTEYFQAIDPEVSTKWLFEEIHKEGPNAKYCVEIIRKANLLDLDKTFSLLDSSSKKLQKFALEILMCKKRYYFKSDIAILNNIIDKIGSLFPELGSLQDSREKWQCQCGKVNKIGSTYCKSCGNDIKGFKEKETKPAEVLLELTRSVGGLKSIFG